MKVDVKQYESTDDLLADLRGELVVLLELTRTAGWADNRLGRGVPKEMRAGIRDLHSLMSYAESALGQYLVKIGRAIR